jgi:hypothetical protein
MHLLAILTIWLAFPITVFAQSLGPQTRQMIREYSHQSELVYYGRVNRDCDRFGLQKEAADREMRNVLRLRRINPVNYANVDPVNKLVLLGNVQCFSDSQLSFARVSVDFFVQLTEEFTDNIRIGFQQGAILPNPDSSEILLELQFNTETKLAEFVAAHQDLEALLPSPALSSF